MKAKNFVLVFVLLAAPLPVKADMITDWNETALEAVRETKTATPMVPRALAIMHAAIYDSVNSIYKSYTPYKFQVSGYTGASAEAAVASAGYNVLKALFPSQLPTLQDKYLNSIGDYTAGDPTDLGIQLGKQVATSMLQLQQNDGWDVLSNYKPKDPSVSGAWQPTPPGFAPFLLPQWGGVTPFAMEQGHPFRQVGPPDLKSQTYADDFNNVKKLGAKNSTDRTAEQTEIAQFWVYGSGTATPPGHWNEIAQTVAQSESNSLIENARLFALLNLGLADAGITAWDMKTYFDFWRPITGIQNAGIDGNPCTLADPNWEPLVNTPNFGSYVSGHSTFSAAAATLLAKFFDDDTIDFSSTSESSGVTRWYDGFWEAAEESGISRIYCGIHWNFDNIYGLAAGKGVGEYVFANFLTPVPLPGTLGLGLTGLSAMLLIGRRQRR
jgi:membrane-associated phospholipid phosphatase